jgi:hypothetical protein
MQAKKARNGKPESQWQWQEVKHTELTPITACYQNKDYPWIIISGKQDVGKYCKAISCPRLPEDATTTDLWFIVALARVEMRDGKRVTVLDEPMEQRRIRQGDLGVVFRSMQERKSEPEVYEGVRATSKKWGINELEAADEADTAQADANQDNVVDGEAEGSTAKKPRIDDVDAGNEVEVHGVAEPNVESTGEGLPEVNTQEVAAGSKHPSC